MDILSDILKLFSSNSQDNNLVSVLSKLLSNQADTQQQASPPKPQNSYWQLPNYQYNDSPPQPQPSQPPAQNNNQSSIETLLKLAQIVIQLLQNKKADTQDAPKVVTPPVQIMEESKIEKLKRTKTDY